MNVLVVGYGSIGVRHARVALSLGANVGVVTKRTDVDGRRFESVPGAHAFAPDVVIIATETGRHRDALGESARTFPKARILVEKPLFAHDEALPAGASDSTWVGYCLRFHPAVQAVVEHVRERELFAIQATVGQHLATWRPGTDYRASYSARAGEGGALRDLSHELDLVHLVAGPWRTVAALVSHVSDLEIASDDTASLLVEAQRCPHVSIHVDTIDRAPRRSFIVHAKGTTAEADLAANIVRIDGSERRLEVERDEIFAAQLRAVMDGDGRWLCNVADARHTMRLIDAAERSAREHIFVRSGETA